MALSRSRRRGFAADYWPGFVDAMATLLLVVTFLLSLFMLAQYFITQEASGKDNVLRRLNAQIAQLTELLALEQTGKKSVDDGLSALSATLAASEAENTRLRGLLEAQSDKSEKDRARATSFGENLDEQKSISAEALARVELLNQQIAALRRQIGALEQALEASEKRDRESQTRIADLGKRLNVALAKRVQELARFRSEFFGRLREVLGQRQDIRIVGDRFVFQAEVLFASGSAEVNEIGRDQLDKLAAALGQLEGTIPGEINWVLRIDGHTDINPIATEQFPSNWELSSARALSVVQYLIERGVSPNRLVAAGFGEFQPLDKTNNAAALRRNRRIELKLTER
jgi:chemotaxis protein MotB